jgi:hypothetical protein
MRGSANQSASFSNPLTPTLSRWERGLNETAVVVYDLSATHSFYDLLKRINWVAVCLMVKLGFGLSDRLALFDRKHTDQS